MSIITIHKLCEPYSIYDNRFQLKIVFGYNKGVLASQKNVIIELEFNNINITSTSNIRNVRRTEILEVISLQ